MVILANFIKTIFYFQIKTYTIYINSLGLDDKLELIDTFSVGKFYFKYPLYIQSGLVHDENYWS